LCAARIGLAGRDARIAEAYLRALGATVVAAGTAADCSILAGATESASICVREATASIGPIVWYVVDGGAIEAGVASSAAELGDFGPDRPEAETVPGVAEVAACDAIATAAALMLGWDDVERAYRVALT
jgi:hypothetical protein